MAMSGNQPNDVVDVLDPTVKPLHSTAISHWERGPKYQMPFGTGIAMARTAMTIHTKTRSATRLITPDERSVWLA